tara:strand:+ start:2740 stop:3621 length:882 start_codon:yes stop_codon:yes gene_type:complete
MATVNLGRIKPVFRGAYSGSTAYVVDDIVTSGNETYICIQAHGAGTQAVTQTAYWTKLAAKGADGSDGTDVGTTITTQGDILYRDGSGLARLAAGTAGHVLQTGGSGANPSWTAVSSDYVRITTSTISSNVGDVQIDNIFSATYKNYVIIGTNIKGDTQDTSMRFRFLDGSGTQLTGSNYRGHSGGAESAGASGNNTQMSNFDGDDIAQLRPAGNVVDNSRGGFNFVMNIPDPFPNATTQAYGTYGCIRNNGNALSGHFHLYYNSNSASRGVKFDYASGNIASGTIAVYGLKT